MNRFEFRFPSKKISVVFNQKIKFQKRRKAEILL